MSSDDGPVRDVKRVVDEEIKEWHFHIYFFANNERTRTAALDLRDAVLKLRKDGAFVAVPLFRVNLEPIGPHPIGSYEIWVPAESFASVFSYLAINRGQLSILVHPLTREQRKDHEIRNAWIGPSFPLNLDTLPLRSDEIPFQYPELQLGYSSKATPTSLEERKKAGRAVEKLLRDDLEAAPAP